MSEDRLNSDPPGWLSDEHLGCVWVDVPQEDDPLVRRQLAWAEWDRVKRMGFMGAVEKFRHFTPDPGYTLTEEEASIIEIACQIIEEQAP